MELDASEVRHARNVSFRPPFQSSSRGGLGAVAGFSPSDNLEACTEMRPFTIGPLATPRRILSLFLSEMIEGRLLKRLGAALKHIERERLRPPF